MTRSRWIVLSLLAAVALPTLLLLGEPPPVSGDPLPAANPPRGDGGTTAAKSDGRGEFHVPAPPFSQGVFPCSDCHNQDREPDPTRRELSEHDFKFEHDPEHRWCFDCHNITNYDTLRLASGAPLDFAESYKLCGQCHGDKFRDWRAGIHGRRTGQWNGQKTYLLCVHCHNPHSPHFRPLKPEPPPVRPERLR